MVPCIHNVFRLSLLALLISSFSAHAGLFDDPSNLEILPKDISAGELRDTMRGFSQGTGARCSSS